MIQRKSYVGVYHGKMMIDATINEMVSNVDINLLQLDAVRMAVEFVAKIAPKDITLRIMNAEKGPVFTFTGGRIRALQVSP